MHFQEAKTKALMPFLYHHVLVCDSKAQQYTIEDHDITLRLPEEAVDQGEIVHLEIGVAMYGPFYFPENTQPISPVIWLCLLEDTNLKKPFQLIVPHFLTEISEDRIYHHKVAFAKASHHIQISKNDAIGYTFHEFDTKPIFASYNHRSYGILVSQHFCFYCLTAEQTAELALDAGYGLVRIETFLSPQRNQVHFCAIYLLNTCLKVSWLLDIVTTRCSYVCVYKLSVHYSTNRAWKNNFHIRKATKYQVTMTSNSMKVTTHTSK